MLEFQLCEDGTYVVLSPLYVCVLRNVSGVWNSDEHDTEGNYFSSEWHRQIADKLDELNGGLKMTNKVKGWLMLSPLIAIFYILSWHFGGIGLFFVLILITAIIIYACKAIELIMEDDK